MTITPEQLAEWRRAYENSKPGWSYYLVQEALPLLLDEVERLQSKLDRVQDWITRRKETGAG